MAFTLYNAPQSTCSQRVRFVLNAKGLAFEERKLDLLEGDQLKPDYLALDHFDISYGMSFGKFLGRYFRIGHLGDTNDLTILGALAGTEMALTLAGVPIKKGGVQAAMDYITSVHGAAQRVAAE